MFAFKDAKAAHDRDRATAHYKPDFEMLKGIAASMDPALFAEAVAPVPVADAQPLAQPPEKRRRISRRHTV